VADRERIGRAPAKEEPMPNIVGGCLCGGVRYEGEAEPVLTAVCHCTHCQKQTSSAFSVLVVLPKGVLRTEGLDLAAFEDVGSSGQPVLRKFCPRCGSPVVADVAVTPEWDWLMAGTLDDPSWLKPQMNIWCSSAQPWVSMDDAVPAFEGAPSLGG
jgi:hypothetical protein